MSKRLRSEIVERLDNLPGEILALESAMEEFGEDFELKEFKPSLREEGRDQGLQQGAGR